MGLLDQIRADLTDAMKAKDKTVVSTLRSIVAAVQEAEVAGSSAAVSYTHLALPPILLV